MNVLPVDGDAAAGHIVKPGNQVAQGGFSSAAGAYQGHVLARADGHVQPGQHFVLFVVGIVEAHFLKADLPLYLAQGLGAGVVLDLHRRVHDFAEALDAGHAALELLGEVHDAADGGEQRGNIQQERDVIAHGDFAVL